MGSTACLRKRSGYPNNESRVSMLRLVRRSSAHQTNSWAQTACPIRRSAYQTYSWAQVLAGAGTYGVPFVPLNPAAIETPLSHKTARSQTDYPQSVHSQPHPHSITIMSLRSGTYEIYNVGANKYFDLKGSNIAPDTNIIGYQKTGNPNQKVKKVHALRTSMH